MTKAEVKIIGLHAEMTEQEVENKLVEGLEKGLPLDIDREKDWPTFSLFLELYWTKGYDLLGGLNKKEREYVLDYITRHGLNVIY